MIQIGRKYEGLDHQKITVKLDERLSGIVRQYMQDTLWDHPETKHGKTSDVIRDAVSLLGDYMELSDLMETSCANLLDIAQVFDKIDGPTAPIYSEALREAAALLWLLCYNNKDAKPPFSIVQIEDHAGD